MRSDKRPTTMLKIMQQWRVKGGMAYGLKCEGVSLTLTVSPRASEADIEEWHIEARAKASSRDEVLMDGWGPTRIDALRALGRAWTTAQFEHGLNMFDWEDVARILADVRAV